MNSSFIELAAATTTASGSSVFAIDAPEAALKRHPGFQALTSNDALHFTVAPADASFTTILNLGSADFTRNLALISDRIARGDRLLLNVRIDGADFRAVTAAKDLGAYEFVSTDSAKESYDFFLLSVLLLTTDKDAKSVIHFYKPQDDAPEQLPYTSQEISAWLEGADAVADASAGLRDALAQLKNLAGTQYEPIKTYPSRGWLRMRSFQQALLLLGDGAVFEPQLSASSTVLAQIKVYRPFPLEEVRKALAQTSVSALQVAQQTALQLQFSPLLLDVLDLLPEVSKAGAQVVCSQIAGASTDNAGAILAHMAQNAALDAPVQNLTFGRSASAPASRTAAAEPPDNVYLSILLHEAAKATKASILNEYGSGKSPEYALGEFLRAEAQRQALADLIESKLAGFQGELNERLAQWVVWARSAGAGAGSKTARPAVDAGALVAALESAAGNTGSSAAQAAAELLAQRSVFGASASATWIVGSDSWSHDDGLAAFHGALKTGNKNLKLLIIDSDDSVSRRQGKKDLGLFALNYGNAYVASVAVYSSYTQTLAALEEASAFTAGPAVVVAYMPRAGAGAVESLRATRRAVDTGYWPLYRFNPTAKEDAGRFKLDSSFIRRELQEFLKQQNRLTALAAKSAKLEYNLRSYNAAVGKCAADKRRLAYAALVEGMAGEPLTVGYASDNGNAAGLAKKFAFRAGRKGFKVRLVELDGIDVASELPDLETFVAITSTSGQGEFPNGGKQFWEALRGSAVDLARLRTAVFALGDSKYWPRPEDSGYFARPGRQLDARLKALGAHALCGCGIGDDQDEDGFSAGYAKWEPEVWRALGVSVENSGDEPAPLTNEQMKLNSNYLRGTIQEGFEDETTGAISASDQQLTKFHGVYMQDDRDLRDARRAEGLEPAYAFMVRVRLPGNVSTPQQWLQIDKLSDTKGNHTFKITTRGTYQLHGIVKKDIVAAVRDINALAMDTLGACGDVNRNTICSAAPTMRRVHEQMAHMARIISARLMPHTLAYHELFLTELGPVARGEEGGPRRPAKYQVGGHAVAPQGGAAEEAERMRQQRQQRQERGAPGSPYGNDPVEPMYGPAYLPRKIKVAITVPPFNDVDVYANDIGLVSVVEDDKIVGFNLLVGGGMGVTHNNTKTYPRAGTLLGFIEYDQAPEVCENIVIIQRDNGDRNNRKHARLKYTIDTMGVEEFQRQLEQAVGFKLQPARPFQLKSNRDHFGWCKDEAGFNHFTCYIENGRVADTREQPHKTGMRLVAQYMIDHGVGVFRLTGNQHVIVADITDAHKASIDAILRAHALSGQASLSGLRMASQSCVAFPTCGLAMAEAERYLPQFLTKLEDELDKLGLRSDSIVLRMTGCPNGCARPWLAEVALVGKSYGFYNLLLGGSYVGDRVNKLYRANVDEKQALAILVPLFRRWAAERKPGEHFGDFVVRVGVIKATLEGRHFWDDLNADVLG